VIVLEASFEWVVTETMDINVPMIFKTWNNLGDSSGHH
jgi:hypothetical protein